MEGQERKIELKNADSEPREKRKRNTSGTSLLEKNAGPEHQKKQTEENYNTTHAPAHRLARFFMIFLTLSRQCVHFYPVTLITFDFLVQKCEIGFHKCPVVVFLILPVTQMFTRARSRMETHCGEQGCRDACISTLLRTLPCHASG